MTKFLEWLKTKKKRGKTQCFGDFGHLMEMLWIPLISQIGRNHQNMWKKNSVFEGPWQRMDVLWNHKLAEVIKKNTKTQKTLEKKRVFSPLLFRPGDLYIYLQSPAVILSSDPPQPIDLVSAYLFIYMYVCIYIYIYMCVFTFIFIYIYIYLQSPAVILSSGPPQPIDLLSAYLFIHMYVCIYIYMYLCMYIFFHSYIFTCNHLQSF